LLFGVQQPLIAGEPALLIKVFGLLHQLLALSNIYFLSLLLIRGSFLQKPIFKQNSQWEAGNHPVSL
jgi:hypothetical protein